MDTSQYAARRASAQELPRSQRLRLAHPKDRAAAREDRKDATGTMIWARGNQLAMALVTKADPTKGGLHGKVIRVATRLVNKAVAADKLKVEKA